MSQASPPRPGPWEHFCNLAPAAGLLLFHLFLLPGYGVFRDELYYMACGRRPAWGYVDHPPLVGWVAWAVRQLAGDSHLALRVVAALSAATFVFLVGRIARELGGGPYARLLAGLAAAALPVCLSLGCFYSMNAFDLVFWATLYWILLRLLSGGDPRLWALFGGVAGLGLLNKISILFLGFGLVVGLVISRRLDVFRSRWIWLGGCVAVLVFLPHLAWQHAHSWPTLEFMENARRDKMVSFSTLQFLGQALLQSAPVAWIWVLGVGWLLVSRRTASRPVGVLFVVVLAVLIYTGGKPYYLAAAYSAPVAAGAVALEALTAHRLRWARPTAAGAVLVVGLLLSPFARPVLPVESFVRYATATGIAAKPAERHAEGRLPQLFADMHGWRAMAETVAKVVRGLSEDDRSAACIVGQNYGVAGAMEYFGPLLGLPPALSPHNSYWLWGPGDCTGQVLVVVGDRRQRLEELFDSVEQAALFTCRDCMPYESGQAIWVVRGPKVSLGAVWQEIKHFQ